MTSQHPASQPEYWRQRWAEGATGWHRDGINPQLAKWWSALEIDEPQSVLVPLCGSSLDLQWLASQGHEVFGVEASDLAVDKFFQVAEVEPQRRPLGDGSIEIVEAGSIHLYCGDFFALRDVDFPELQCAYDRAALVALPPATRPLYMKQLHRLLAPGAKVLLVAFEYPQEVKAGPPFSVEEEEVRRLSQDLFTVELLHRFDLKGKEEKFSDPAFSYVAETVYLLTAL
jgi:thiopurine S-methyltransferase